MFGNGVLTPGQVMLLIYLKMAMGMLMLYKATSYRVGVVCTRIVIIALLAIPTSILYATFSRATASTTTVFV
jgi:hypothetical protein